MSNEVKVDALFVGLTRPPMLLGVSYNFVVFNVFICMTLYIEFAEFKYFALMLPMHLIGYHFCSKEPLFIELFRIKSAKCPRRRNTLYHNGNSYDPS